MGQSFCPNYMSDIKEQFGHIYDEYIEKIYRFVYLKVNSVEMAEDISAKVFLKGWENYKVNYNSIQNIGAFLYQIARNSVIDYYRDKDRTKVVSSDYQMQIIDSGTNIHEKAALNEDMAIIKSAIQKLKKDYQDVIIWHYLEDMSIADISEILNKPAGTVRVMIHRGLKFIKEELKGLA